eukprot:scaffold15808_cov132-Amphora_coffeaeformis.AAC.2
MDVTQARRNSHHSHYWQGQEKVGFFRGGNSCTRPLRCRSSIIQDWMKGPHHGDAMGTTQQRCADGQMANKVTKRVTSVYRSIQKSL